MWARVCSCVCNTAQNCPELMSSLIKIADIYFLFFSFLPPCLSGREVDVLPIWRLHPAGGAADAEHHGGVRLAHLLHRHVQVSGLPGVHQHLEDDSGQQVGSAGRLFISMHFQF